MAGKKARKLLDSEVALKKHDERIGEKEPTAAQAKERDALVLAVKTEKFKVLGKKHVEAACRSLDKVAKLANTKKYAYTPEQQDKIGAAISMAMNAVKAAFEGKKVAGGFEL